MNSKKRKTGYIFAQALYKGGFFVRKLKEVF